MDVTFIHIFFLNIFPEKQCKPIADIGFVIDSSGSIGRSNWGRMKRFLKALVSKLDVSPSTTHISAVAYSNNPEVVLRFRNRQSTDDVNSAFDGMRWQRGFTYTDKALLLADSDLLQSTNGMRPNVGKVRRCSLTTQTCIISLFALFMCYLMKNNYRWSGYKGNLFHQNI